MPSLTLPDTPTVSLPELPDLPDVSSLSVPKRSRPAAQQLAQELSIAALLGGNLFGRVAMNPALGRLADAGERGKVVNSAWRRYGTVNSLALAGLVAGWLPARSAALGGLHVSRRDRTLIRAKDIALAAVVVTGLSSAAAGVGFAHEAPDGAVPLNDGHDSAPETPVRAARLKRAVNLLGGLNLASELVFLGLDAVLAPRRPRLSPLR
jgi:hypothetical protein